MQPNQRFDRIFDEHRAAVLGFALRRAGDPADAADVLAETFLVAWRRLESVPGGDGTRPWLLGVARRALANQRRGAMRRAGLSERLAGEIAAQQAAATNAASEGDERIQEALARLSDEDREVLLLTAWEGLTPSQIATVVGAAAVTVRSRLHRARRRLRVELEAADLDPDPDLDTPLRQEQFA